MVDGRAADVPLGCALSRHDGPDRAVLRLREMLTAQFCLSGGRQGRVDGGRRLEGRLVHREAATRLTRGGAGLCRLGFFPRVLSPEAGYRVTLVFLAAMFLMCSRGRIITSLRH